MALAACLGCSRSRPEKAPASDAPDLRIAVVTDLKGYLEPCGCTSNPLGGIDRLAAQVKTLRKEPAPVAFLLAGDTFFDVAELEPAREDQALRNATTLAGILQQLEADAILPGERDRAQPPENLNALREASGVAWLAMGQVSETVPLQMGELRVAVVGVAPRAERDAVRAEVERARAKSDLVIALVSGSRRDANRIGALEGVDFVVQGGLDQDAPMAPRQAGGGWVFHASRQGQGLTVVDVFRRKQDQPFEDRSEWSRTERDAQLGRQIDDLTAKISEWEASGSVDATALAAQRGRLAELEAQRKALAAPSVQGVGNSFFARWVELPKAASSDREVAKLMRKHDRAVNDANRIAFAGLKPPPLGPNDIAYVGSQACSTCHMEAFMWWRNSRHGVAYMTLQKRNKEYNLDCVGCHVTGYEQPGGSTVTHNLDRALVNVGCESCHGPGAAHTANPEVAILRDTPDSTCLACHNEQHSDLFDYESFRAQLVAPGHGLPTIQR